jgi:hypothetical protein
LRAIEVFAAVAVCHLSSPLLFINQTKRSEQKLLKAKTTLRIASERKDQGEWIPKLSIDPRN